MILKNHGITSPQICLFLSQQCFSWQDADSAISIFVKGRHELKLFFISLAFQKLKFDISYILPALTLDM